MSGPQCCSNPPTLDPSSGAGHVDKLGGLDSYVTGSPSSKHAVLFASDIFGYEAPNLRKLADKIAASGFFVAVPDFFHGEPYATEDISGLEIWLKDHGTDKGVEEAKLVIEDLKSKGFSAIGVAGFCWGAKVVIDLANLNNIIQAGALLHPSFVKVDDFKGAKVPIAILGAEIDQFSPPELVKQFEEVLRAKPEIDYFVKIYQGAEHGWTTRYDVHDEAARKRSEEAHEDLLVWLTKHVK